MVGFKNLNEFGQRTWMKRDWMSTEKMFYVIMYPYQREFKIYSKRAYVEGFGQGYFDLSPLRRNLGSL